MTLAGGGTTVAVVQHSGIWGMASNAMRWPSVQAQPFFAFPPTFPNPFLLSLMDLNQNNLNDQTELKARGNWNQLKGEAKQKWGQLTDDDLDYEDGKQDEWFGRLQEKTGHAVDDIKNWFNRTF
jgi:uncharacterized protein YjbJ (UPF0337 family)